MELPPEQPQARSSQNNPWLAGLQTAGGRLSVLAGAVGAIGLVLDRFLGILKQLKDVAPRVDLFLALAGVSALLYYYQIVRRLKRTPARQITAFIGPSSFTQADEDRFFGRDGEIDDLCRRISDQYSVVCTVFGQSGCGKTSLIRAGVIPEVERRFGYKGIYVRLYNQPEQAIRTTLDEVIGARSDGAAAAQSSDTASASPLPAQLTSAKEATGKTLVFFIDQFEEFFLSEISEVERNSFLDFLKAPLADHQPPRPKVVFLIRGDFLYRMASLEALTTEDILSRTNRFALPVFDKMRANTVIRESLMAAVGRQGPLPWTDELIDVVLDDLVLEKTEIDIGETHTFILPAELQIVCQVVQQRGWTRSDQYSNKV